MSCSSRAFELFFPPLDVSPMRVFLCRMGTTAKNAGSPENFTKIDKEYVVVDNPTSSSSLFHTSPSVTAHTLCFV